MDVCYTDKIIGWSLTSSDPYALMLYSKCIILDRTVVAQYLCECLLSVSIINGNKMKTVIHGLEELS